MEKDIILSKSIKKILDVPILLNIHGIYYSHKILSKYLPFIDQIIFVSKYSKNYYLNLLNKLSFYKYEVIPNSTEFNIKYTPKFSLKSSLNIPENSILITYCSRLSYSKSKLAIIFLKAIKKRLSKNRNLYAVILGDGDYRSTIELTVNNINKKLCSNIIFMIGNRFNVLDYYYGSDIVVGTGRVALEALSIAKPVISLGLGEYVDIVNKKTIKKMIDSNFGDHPRNAKLKFFQLPFYKLIILKRKLNKLLNNLFNNKR